VTPNTSVDRTLEVPRFAIGGHLRGRLLRQQPGGKGVNVARCLAVLGVQSLVTGFVGRRELPLFRESLPPVVASELVPVAEPTRTNTTILDPERGTDTHIRETGFAVRTQEVEALLAKLRAIATPDAVVVFCGSLPPGMTAAALGSLLAACRERGAEVAADLNGADLGAAVAARPLLIKPNVEELGECLGRDLSEAGEGQLLTAARALCDRVGTVLLTRGREGALAVRSGEALAASVEIGVPRNTVGCGDALLAGYLAGLWRGSAFSDALRLAVACGAAQALADAPGHLSPELAENLAKAARIRHLP